MTPSPSKPPHTPRRWQIGPGRAAAMGQQRAQERHGCRRRLSRGRSAENCAPSSQVPPRNRGLCGPGACILSGLRGLPRSLPDQCWGPSAPTLDSEMMRLFVRSRVGAHVSPSQICYCSQSLSDSERPLKFSLIPLFFLEEEQAQDSVCRASGPFTSISPCGPPSTPSLHWSLCLGAVARLQDFISKWWGRGCDHTGEGLKEATPER